MVLKFEEFINEGFVNKTLKRVRTGEKRLGERTPFDDYIPTIEWVEMGHPDYLFAKDDFIEDELMTIDEIRKLKLPDGIEIVDEDTFRYLFDTTKYTLSKKGVYPRHWRFVYQNNEIHLNEVDKQGLPSFDYFCEFDNDFVSYLTLYSSNLFSTRSVNKEDARYTVKLMKKK